MKRFMKYMLVLVLVLAGAWLFVFELAIPFSARANIPYHWQNIPLGQKRTVVHEYLGMPGFADNRDVMADSWIRKVNAHDLQLDVSYHTDTTAKEYQVLFFYRSWLVDRKYVLKNATVLP